MLRILEQNKLGHVCLSKGLAGVIEGHYVIAFDAFR